MFQAVGQCTARPPGWSVVRFEGRKEVWYAWSLEVFQAGGGEPMGDVSQRAFEGFT